MITNTFEIFEGRLGGGKSYNACLRIIDRLARGGTVATNMELNRAALTELLQKKFKVIPRLDEQLFILSEDQIADFHNHIPLGSAEGLNPLIVIDEFHLWFNARDFGATNKNHRPTLTFITQARKLHVDILLISQSALNIDKQFIRMLHGIWRFRDLEKWIMPGLGFRMPGCRNYILACHYDQDGKTLLNRYWVKKDQAVFSSYETASLLRPITGLSDIKGVNLELEKVASIPWTIRVRPYAIVGGFAVLPILGLTVRYFLETFKFSL